MKKSKQITVPTKSADITLGDFQKVMALDDSEVSKAIAILSNLSEDEVNAMKESDVQKSEEQPVPQQRPPIDEKTQEWIDNNKSWFGKVKGMTATAYDIHDDLMGEGYEGSSDDYFNELQTILDGAGVKQITDQIK